MKAGTVLTQIKEEPMEEMEGRGIGSSPFPLPFRGKSQVPLSQPTFPGKLTNKTDPLIETNIPNTTSNSAPKEHRGHTPGGSTPPQRSTGRSVTYGMNTQQLVITQTATNLISQITKGPGLTTMGIGAVSSTIPIMSNMNTNNRILRGFSMPPLARANLGMAGTASADEHHRETMIENLMECIRQAPGVQLKFPDGYKPNLKFDGSGPSKYDGSPKFSELEKWLSALAYRYALLKFGGPDLDTDRICYGIALCDSTRN